MGQSVVSKRRMFSQNWRLFLPLPFLVLAMVSCSGGGIEGNLAGGGIGGTGYASVGPITALGSIYVNGIEFKTTSATITINGATGHENELQVGMVVKVEGTVNADGKTGKADVVVYNNDVKGPINSNDLASNTLTVVGQTVLVDAQTIIADQSGKTIGLANLSIGDQVEISGMADADGYIKATRITWNPAAVHDDIEVRGLIGWVDATNKTLFINGLSVDYSSATLNNFASGVPNLWDNIVVKGKLTSATTLKANLVEKTSSSFNSNYIYKILGYVGTLYYTDQSISGFDVYTMFGPLKVELSDTTVISGKPLKNIKAGLMVLVEGTIQNNILKATKLQIY